MTGVGHLDPSLYGTISVQFPLDYEEEKGLFIPTALHHILYFSDICCRNFARLKLFRLFSHTEFVTQNNIKASPSQAVDRSLMSNF